MALISNPSLQRIQEIKTTSFHSQKLLTHRKLMDLVGTLAKAALSKLLQLRVGVLVINHPMHFNLVMQKIVKNRNQLLTLTWIRRRLHRNLHQTLIQLQITQNNRMMNNKKRSNNKMSKKIKSNKQQNYNSVQAYKIKKTIEYNNNKIIIHAAIISHLIIQQTLFIYPFRQKHFRGSRNNLRMYQLSNNNCLSNHNVSTVMTRIIGEISFLSSHNNNKLLLLNSNNIRRKMLCKLLELRNKSFLNLINLNSLLRNSYL